MTYAYVQELKAQAEPILQGTNVQINDHAYMRMIDRNMVTIANHQTGHMMSFDEYINLLVTEAQKATDTKLYISGYGNGGILKLLVVPASKGNKIVVIDSVMEQ